MIREADARPMVCVAFSGGLDSTVLLHLLAMERDCLPFDLKAMHVHHGLSPNANAWEEHCVAVCASLGVPCTVVRAYVSRRVRTSLEEEARRSRYAAFCETKADGLLLAHHAEDQAETLLLQLLRGAGPNGLAAMPEKRRLGATCETPLMFRPLLSFERDELRSYARALDLAWIDDESNDDLAIKRNFIRSRIMPALREAFPAPTRTLARAARLQADAAWLIDELADIDLAQVRDGAGLDCRRLVALPRSRQANLLRRWLKQAGARPASEARLGALLDALARSESDTRLTWNHEKLQVVRRKFLLMFEQS